MSNFNIATLNINKVSNFNDFIATPFKGATNAICWNRQLIGNFEEIVTKIKLDGNLTELSVEMLLALQLTEQGQLAREIILTDLNALKANGASPSLNIIECYERDDAFPFFPTDVYSFHVDRSPIPTDTILCTYFGASSDIVPNAKAEQKILIPEIRAELKKLHDGKEEDFESFLSEYFFDLHYQVKDKESIINLGVGHLWRLAVDHPESEVLPCVHRAPNENPGELRLLLIC